MKLKQGPKTIHGLQALVFHTFSTSGFELVHQGGKKAA